MFWSGFWVQTFVTAAVWGVVVFVAVYAAVRLATRELRENTPRRGGPPPDAGQPTSPIMSRDNPGKGRS